ncbi:MAG: GlsB/YeaQ/YmgE family stress response membrane protein [Chloroflexi bacterium]|nr:GlsB/YeaQ/YmgE family stress response membrane protein [Chloroflexota bacterium]
MDIIAWIVLGAIAGYIAGMLVKGDEGLGVVGKIILGIIGAFVGGFLFRLLGIGNPTGGGDQINIMSIIAAVIGAVIVVVVYGMVTGNRRTGSGPI